MRWSTPVDNGLSCRITLIDPERNIWLNNKLTQEEKEWLLDKIVIYYSYKGRSSCFYNGHDVQQLTMQKKDAVDFYLRFGG